jgi:hypothetical protein
VVWLLVGAATVPRKGAFGRWADVNGYTALFLVIALLTGGWSVAETLRRRRRRTRPANVPSAQLAAVLRDQQVRQA